MDLLTDSDSPAAILRRPQTEHLSTSSRKRRAWDPRRRGVVEIIGILVAYNLYEAVRAVCGNAGPALHHAKTIVRVEKDLHLDWEFRIQHFAMAHLDFIKFLNVYYGTVHFIVPAVALWLLWKKSPSQYAKWRNRITCVTLIALVGFWLYPVVPPRLLPSSYGFIDTDAVYGGLGALNDGPGKDLNLYAAMPSLHVGWALWCAGALSSLLTRRAAKLAVWAYPAFTILTVTATGNHYWLDAFGGIAVDLMGYWIGDWVTRSIERGRAKWKLPLVRTNLGTLQHSVNQAVDVP